MSKTCFVISVIGGEGSDERKHADRFLNYIVAPVVTELGYGRPVRADEIAQPGMITTQIIGQLDDADLVVADLSYENGNVFYELAVRHAVHKPVVHMARHGSKVPFDNAQMRTIFFGTDVEEIDIAKRDLGKAAKAVKKSPQSSDNPIVQTIQIKALAKSGDAHGDALARILGNQSVTLTVLAQIAAELFHSPDSPLRSSNKDMGLLSSSVLDELSGTPRRRNVLEEYSGGPLGETSATNEVAGAKDIDEDVKKKDEAD